MRAEALGETFFKLGALGCLIEQDVAFIKESKSECSKATLDKGSVVVDLVAHLLLCDNMLDTCSHDQILGLQESVVDGMMVGL